MFSSTVQAADVPQSITLDGRLFDSVNSENPLLDSNVVINVKILNPDKTCVLYEENQTADTTINPGRFTIHVGSAVGSTKRVMGEPGNSMARVYQNTTPIAATGSTCGGVYTPLAGHVRYMRITVSPSATGLAEVLGPDTIVESVPTAMVAETLQGLTPSQFLVLGNESLTQANVENVFTNANYPRLTSLLSGSSTDYVRVSSGSATIPTRSGAPVTPATGQMWFDTATNSMQYFSSGGVVQTVGVGGGTVNSVGLALPSIFSVTTPLVTTSGTLTAALVPQSAAVVFAGPATGGSAAPAFRSLASTDLPVGGYDTSYARVNGNSLGADINLGTNDAFGLTFRTGGVTRMSITSSGLVGIGTATPSVTLDVAGAVRVGTELTSCSAGLSGSLRNNGGSLEFCNGTTWSALASVAGSIASLGGLTATTQIFSASTGGSSPNWTTAGVDTHVLNIPMASTVGTTAGLISKTEYDALNAKLSSSLATGNIWVGNSAGVATAVAPFGDVLLATTGAMTVDKFRGIPLDTVLPSLAGQVLRYDPTGTAKWTPAFLSMADIRSTATSASIFPSTNCPLSQTLTWSSLTDTFICQNIQISSTQIVYASAAANLIFAGPASGAVASPTFRSLVAADLPAGLYDQTYFKQNGNSFGAGAVLGTNDVQSLSLQTSGAARLTISGTGLVGIGTVTPGQPLDVVGIARAGRFVSNGAINAPGTPGLTFNSDSDSGIYLIANDTLGFSTGSTERMRLTANGSLGIGTANAGAALDIFATGATSAILVPRDTTAGRPTGVNGMIRYNTTLNRLEAFENNAWTSYVSSATAGYVNGGNSFGVTATLGTNDTNTLSFRTNSTDRMTIDTLGKVGIGTATPGADLELFVADTPNGNGAFRVLDGSSGYFLVKDATGSATQFSPLLEGHPSGATRSTILSSTITIAQDTTTDPALILNSERTGGGALTNRPVLDVRNATSSKLLIAANGNIGVGTTTPQALLDLTGTTTANSAILLPRSDTATRPTGVNGMIRYNTTLNRLEAFENNAWTSYVSSATAGYVNGGNSFGVAATLGTNDTNTLSFKTGNVNRMTIGTSGNVGIGTSAPVVLFQVNGLAVFGDGSASSQAFIRGDVNGYSTATNPDYSWFYNDQTGIFHPAADTIAFTTAGTERIRFSSNGRVGIGTTAPLAGARVDISGTGTGDSSLIVPRSTTAARPSTGVNGMIRYNTDLNRLETYENNAWTSYLSSTTAAYVNGGNSFGVAATLGTNDANSLSFQTNAVPRLFIGSTGNVGIGTNAPLGQLEVNGANSNTKLRVISGGAANPATIQLGRTITEGYLTVVASAGQEFTGTASGDLVLRSNSAAIHLGTTPALPPTMSLTSDARVGVGSAAPATGALLDLVGTGVGNSTIIVPRSTTAARPAVGVNGMIRYNTDLNRLETFENNAWTSYVTTATAGYINGGNSFGGAATIGTNDNFSLSLKTNNLNRMTIDGSGNVGIGTAAPNFNLSLGGATTARTIGLEQSTGTNGSNLTVSAGAAAVGATNASGGTLVLSAGASTGFGGSSINFQTATSAYPGSTTAYAATTKMVLSGNGFLGIGNSFPSAKLDVRATGGTLASFVNDAAPAVNTETVMNLGALDSAYNVENFASVVGGTTTVTNGSEAGYLKLSTRANGVLNEALRIDKDQKVGIGTSTPGAILDVYATGAASAVLLPRDTEANRPAGVNGMIRYNTTSQAMEIYGSGAWASIATGSGGGGSSQWTTTGSDLYFANRVRVGSTTAPVYQMDINGTANVTASYMIGGSNAVAMPVAGTVVVGATAAAGNTTATAYTTVVGQDAFNATASGTGNTAIGRNSLQSATTSSGNTAIGNGSLRATTTGPDNVAVGSSALNQNTTGNGNVAVGNQSLNAAINASQNTAIGRSALYNTTGSNNTAVGYYSAFYNTSGTGNAALGDYALSGTASNANSNNTALGSYAGSAITTGSSNVLIGRNAGNTLTSGSSNIIIGAGAVAPSITASNQLNIGGLIYGSMSANTVAIGTSAPVTGAILDLNGTGANNSALMLPRTSVALRPATGVNGMIRYNTDSNRLEAFENNAWTSYVSSASAGYVNGGNSYATAATLGTNDNYTLSFKTNNVSRMTLDTNGNVGIGTTLPNNALSFGGDSARSIAMERSTTATANPLTIQAGGTVAGATNGNGGALILSSGLATGAGGSGMEFRTASPGSSGTADVVPSTKMAILSNGNVGIGTNNPVSGALLDLTGSTANTSSLVVPRATTALRPSTGVNGMIRYNTTLNSFEGFANNAWGSLAAGAAGQWNTGAANSINYTAGNVGIGVANPGVALEVQGTAAFESNTNDSVGSSFSLWKSRSYGLVQANDELGYVSFWGHDGSALRRGAYILAATDGTPAANSMPTKLQFATTPTGSVSPNIRMTVDNAGKVGVGTATPAALLDVFGTGDKSAILIPRDTTALRPTTPVNGMIRYNSTSNSFEGFANNSWGPLNANAAGQWNAGASNTINYTAGNVGIGTTMPYYPLQVSSASYMQALFENTQDGQGTELDLAAYGAGGQSMIFLAAARGTKGAPAYSQANDTIGYIAGSAAQGGGQAGRIVFSADSNWSSTDTSGYMSLATTPIGSTVPAERVRISSAGNVGIGTTAPGYKLDISGGDINLPAGNYYRSNGVAGLSYLTSGMKVVVGSGAAHNLSLYAGAADRMYIDAGAGNVGVGTTAPELRTHIVGVTGFPSSSGTSQPGGLRIGSSGSNRVLDFGVDGATSTAWLQSTNRTDLSAGGPLLLNPVLGNVGVGTTNPQAKLHVNGTLRVDTLNAATATHVCIDGSNVLSACSSSIRYKENVFDLDSSLEKILNLRPVSYDWIQSKGHEVGFIAEEVEKIDSRLVTYNKQGTIQGVKYEQIVAPIVKALQELYERFLGVEGHQTIQDQEITRLKASEEAKSREVASLRVRADQAERDNAAKTKELEAVKARLDRIEKMLKAK